jgi:hypothetical protein
MDKPITAPTASKLTSKAVASLWASFLKLRVAGLDKAAKKVYDDPKTRKEIQGLWKARFLAALTDDASLAAKLAVGPVALKAPKS